MVQPDYSPALQYINMIEEMSKPREAVATPQAQAVPVNITPSIRTQPATAKESMDLMELETEMISERRSYKPETARPMPPIAPRGPVMLGELRLDESLSKIMQPIEIEQGNYITVTGKNIQRFLVTQPNIVTIEKEASDKVVVTGKDVGYTYVHIWDDNGRWTMQFLTTQPKPLGLSVEEEMRMAQEQAEQFKLRYMMDWASFETGRGLRELKRLNYSYLHTLTLFGPTPYGNLDTGVSVRTLNELSEVSYYTLGLDRGKIGPFKDFTFRGFDYTTRISNLAFYDVYMRGVMLKSPAFNNKINYTAFWGRENASLFTTSVAPGIKNTLDAFLSGLSVNFTPEKNQKYSVSAFQGRGSDRVGLKPYGYDVSADYRLADWALGYEAAFDTTKFAHLFHAAYAAPQLQFTTEWRDVNSDFTSMSGLGSRVGELGLLSTVTYTPSEKFRTFGQFDVFRDRKFPNADNPKYWNEDLRWGARYAITPFTYVKSDYTLQNDLGRFSALRYQNAGIEINQMIPSMKKINTFANYQHQENKSFSAAGLNYINEKLIVGARVNLIGQLYYYLNKELNWLKDSSSAKRNHPQALETGLDWSDRILNTNFYGDFRFTYRDEENANTPLSFLAGEDYIEGYGEISWRPTPSNEIYCSTRVRNVWADSPDVKKHIEADFRGGLRYLWDTGFRWDTVGAIEGYVFKDLNDDGLIERDEPPVEGVKVCLGKDRCEVTDLFGYYKFDKVKAKKVHVSIDVSSMPRGFVLTVPAIQDAVISQGQSTAVDFGIISRSEITGIVFEDTNGNGKFDPGEQGIKGVVLILENGTKAVTDNFGKYYLRKAAVGKHTLTLDLNSLPPVYIPALPIFKEIQLFEGVLYTYDIPLKKIRK